MVSGLFYFSQKGAWMKKFGGRYEITLGLGLTAYEEPAEYGATSDRGPDYPEVHDPQRFMNPQEIVKDLKSVDWAFTKDDTGFLTHDLHPYPAKFIPQIPGHLISRLSRRGDLILDPFGGSGTTALEAIRLGRRALSIDANAVGSLIGKVKTCQLTNPVATDLHGIRCLLTGQLQNLPNDDTYYAKKFAAFIPEIPNCSKWFPNSSCGELALIRSGIETLETGDAKNIALLALSKIILKSSFQDSETRYTSKPRHIPVGDTIRDYLASLELVIRSLIQTQPAIRYGVSNFITADTRAIEEKLIPTDSVDLVITSPPYGNAMDYHLYHRFRLLWIGCSPQDLARMEIGSHLRHQKESNGFEKYAEEMEASLKNIFRVLRPGRHACFVVGDSIYENTLYESASTYKMIGANVGFNLLCVLERPLHQTKRSFVAAGRRASTENIVVFVKPDRPIEIALQPPPYKLWPYEEKLRDREITNVLNTRHQRSKASTVVSIDSHTIADAKRLVFSHDLSQNAAVREQTWQAILENGLAKSPSNRKDPKYVTHGIHPYKGKFYPQLAKGLINLSHARPGSFVLDPFCGSGTTVLEGYLNGFKSFGFDMNPLAAKIARAKVGIVETNPDILREAVFTILRKIEGAESITLSGTDQFPDSTLEEIHNWFPRPVIGKINYLLKTIRSVSSGVLRDFFEVILSSVIRDVSQQDPNDLRVRRRKTPIEDADVYKYFCEQLEVQYHRIDRFWSVRGYAPNKFYPANVYLGDTREWATFENTGSEKECIDLVLTSPPYATALPYIDTDRLSLLTILGMEVSERRPIEHGLIGSREIITSEKRRWETSLFETKELLPGTVQKAIRALADKIGCSGAGFRRQNMPALLTRFFSDMGKVLENCYRLLKPNGQAMIVIGDNRISIDDEEMRIPTTDWLLEVGKSKGFQLIEKIDISVTTENLVHIKNAIKENVVLWLGKTKKN